MRKHFLLLFLMAILPLAGWAADGDITEPAAQDLTYSGAAQELVAGGAVAGANYTLRYAMTQNATEVPNWEAFSTTVPTGTTAGTYYVFFASYNSASGQHSMIGPKVSVIIKKANIANADFTAPVYFGQNADGLTFKGKTESQKLIKTAGNCAIGTFQYKLGENGTWTAESNDIAAINADSYKVYYKIIGDANHNDRVYVDPAAANPVDLSITVEIAAKNLPAANTVGAYTFTASNPTYNGLAITSPSKLPVFTAEDGDDDLEAGTDYVISWHKGNLATAEATPFGAGTYFMKITGTGNYATTSVISDEVNWKFIVNRKPISIYVEDKAMTYNGDAIPTTAATTVDPFHINDVTIMAPGLAQVDITAGLKNDLFAKFENPDYNDVVPSTYAVDGYPMIAFVKDGVHEAEWANYEIDNSSFGAYSINKRNVTVTVRDQGDFTYTGSAIPTSDGDTRANGKIWLKPVVNAAATTYTEAEAIAYNATLLGHISAKNDITDGEAAAYNALVPGGAKVAGENITEAEAIEANYNLAGAKHAGDLKDAEVDGTITIEPEDVLNNTGLIAVDQATFVAGLTLTLKDEVVAVGTADVDYAGYLQVAGTLDNYTVTPVNGGVTVVGKPLKVIATSFTEGAYGDKLSDFTFTYRTNPANLTLKDGIEYKVYDADENEVTDYDAILDAGTYSIRITENPALAPDNYTITAFMEGELVIAQQRLDITIDDVALNTGDTQTELTKYVSINDSYKSNLKTANDIQVAVEFDDIANLLKDYDADLTDDVHIWGLKSAEEYTAAGYAKWTASTSTLTGVTKLVFDAADDANKNYDIHFTPGNIVLGGAKTLKIDYSDQMASKIGDAAAAGVNYNVTFGAKTMKANEWYAIVLPFATSAYDLVKQLGQYVVINTYGDDSNPGHIQFHLEMGDIAAGVPFLIKAGAELNWNGKKFDDRLIVDAPVAQGTLADNGSVFTGVFSTGNVLLNGYELDGTTANDELAYRWLSDSDYEGFSQKKNTWRAASANDHHKRNLNALEAYLQIRADLAPARITVEDFDGQTTSIQELSAGDMKAVVADGWYTIDGIKLQSAPTQKGIYINNGKKVVLK